jgi:hypothetical protein
LTNASPIPLGLPKMGCCHSSLTVRRNSRTSAKLTLAVVRLRTYVYFRMTHFDHLDTTGGRWWWRIVMICARTCVRSMGVIETQRPRLSHELNPASVSTESSYAPASWSGSLPGRSQSTADQDQVGAGISTSSAYQSSRHQRSICRSPLDLLCKVDQTANRGHVTHWIQSFATTRLHPVS